MFMRGLKVYVCWWGWREKIKEEDGVRRICGVGVVMGFRVVWIWGRGRRLFVLGLYFR